MKFLGHTGTHQPGGVNLESVNHGLVLISTALEARYEHQKADALADKIIKEGGPISTTKPKKGPFTTT